MKIPSPLLAAIVILACLQAALAGKPMWPKQAKLSSAYESLTVALKQIELSKAGEPRKHLARASAEMVSAKTDLETAKKNKGSARLVAIDQIDQAKTGLDAGKLDDASACLSKALEQITRAAANGR